jgi:hypothetical protein
VLYDTYIVYTAELGIKVVSSAIMELDVAKEYIEENLKTW